MADFYAVIDNNSKYAGQDGGVPFAVTLTRSSDGYIWEGNSNRYRTTDLILLMPCDSPLKELKAIPVFIEDDEPVSQEAIEIEYQMNLMKTQWFQPLSHQYATPWFQCINRDGKLFTGDKIGHYS